MKKALLLLLFLSACTGIIFPQTSPNLTTCSAEDMLARQLQYNPNAIEEMEVTEAFIQARVKKIQQERAAGIQPKGDVTYIIPVVLHVFHNGEEAYLDMEQLQSGLDIINDDFNGLNEDWGDIDPDFDAIKASMRIQLCLASIDPFGDPTTGVIYYDNEDAMLNNIGLYQYAWDNYKYLNIYLPKYTEGQPSLFTAYANLPSTSTSDNGQSGITYSSIRWGYGTHSELDDGQEWASVGTHEMGHWLNLYHTFRSGCSLNSSGDHVDDTPRTLGSGIELEGCYNNDFSCFVATNGSNYMDYNHDCKKMFTQGQVDRMTAAMEHPARITIWSEENLIATGCADVVTTRDVLSNESVRVSPNPARAILRFSFTERPQQIAIYDTQGKSVHQQTIMDQYLDLDVSRFPAGLYFYTVISEDNRQTGRFVVSK